MYDVHVSVLSAWGKTEISKMLPLPSRHPQSSSEDKIYNPKMTSIQGRRKSTSTKRSLSEKIGQFLYPELCELRPNIS